MQKRKLGNTGMEISEIGLGAWGLGGVYYGPVEKEEGVAAVRAYLNAGGNHLDSAYSYHTSEEIISEAIKGYNRDELVLVSKSFAGLSHERLPRLRKEIEISLRDYGTDYIDLYYIHGPADEKSLREDTIAEYIKLKEEGKIRAIGVSLKGAVVDQEVLDLGDAYLATNDIEVVQMIYSPLRQMNADFFQKCADQGVGVVVRTVLESGFLTGKYKPGHEFVWPDVRVRYVPEHRDHILQVVQDEFISLPLPDGYENHAQLAAKFCLANPNVSGIIMGANKASQVERNAAIDKLPPLPGDLVKTIEQRFAGRTEEFNPYGELEHVPSIRS
ncbi:MAG: aldo/keto reductase [Phycisphaeraceae bacterium]